MKLLRILFLVSAIALIFFSLGNGEAPASPKPMPAHGMPPATPADTVKAIDSLKLKNYAWDPADTLFGPDDYIVVETHHQMYPDFLQVDTVKFHQRFQLGEEPLFAEAFVFVPDLKITMKGEKIKTSDTLYNPAVQLRVFLTDTTSQKDSLVQQSWAFYYGGAPHYSRNAFFAFTLKDFKVANPRYIRPPEGK